MQINNLRQIKASERSLSDRIGLSRGTLRKLLRGEGNPRLSSFQQVSEFLNLNYEHFFSSSEPIEAEFSVPVLSYKLRHEPADAWKLHLMEFVDHFRRDPDYRLIINPPIRSLRPKLQALIAAVVWQLARENQVPLPQWLDHIKTLEEPWFVSGIENLKASALIESPLAFRSFNIFVLGNFLDRV